MKKRANGEYSIYKSDGGWRGQMTVGFNDEGKQVRKSVSGKTKQEVFDKLKSLENKIKTGIYVDKSEITLYQLCTAMLDEQLNLNQVKEVSHQRNLETLKIMKPIYNIPIQKLNDETLRRFMASTKGYSESIISKVYSLLKRTINEAVRRKIISENIMADISKPKSTQKSVKVRALTENEQKKLFDVLVTDDVPYAAQMLLSMMMGMRMGEINALQVNDINFKDRTITISRTITRGRKGEAVLGTQAKTEAGTRTITMSDDVVSVLTEAIGDKTGNEQIFTANDKLVTTEQVNLMYRKIIEVYGIIDNSLPGKVDLHSLRHTFATRCVEANMPPKVLQNILGHSDIKTTMNIYADVTKRNQENQIANLTNYLANIGIKIDNKIKATM